MFVFTCILIMHRLWLKRINSSINFKTMKIINNVKNLAKKVIMEVRFFCHNKLLAKNVDLCILAHILLMKNQFFYSFYKITIFLCIA